MTPLLQNASKTIHVSLSLQKDIPHIKTNFNEIKQVVLNIIKNAAEAIDSKGTMSISTSYNADSSSNYLTMEFSDNGKGISEEIAKKIFDPFFTTKTAVGGTGLGLTVCKKIICENHHGVINVKSGENKGTTVVIMLPVNYDPQSNKHQE